MRQRTYHTLIYDASCPFCTAAAEWAEDHTSPYDLDTLPCQSEERAEEFPSIAEEDCMEAVHLVTPQGRVYRAEEVFPRLLRLTKYYWPLAYLFQIPGAGLITPHVYNFVARHRQEIGAVIGKKTCKHHEHAEETPSNNDKDSSP